MATRNTSGPRQGAPAPSSAAQQSQPPTQQGGASQQQCPQHPRQQQEQQQPSLWGLLRMSDTGLTPVSSSQQGPGSRSKVRKSDAYYQSLPKRSRGVGTRAQAMEERGGHSMGEIMDERGGAGPAMPDPAEGMDHALPEGAPGMAARRGAAPQSHNQAQSRSQRMHERWRASMPDLLEQYVMRHGMEAAGSYQPGLCGGASPAQKLLLRAQQVMACMGCPLCGYSGAGAMQAVVEASTAGGAPRAVQRVRYCGLSGSAEVARPAFACTQCRREYSPPPVLLRCFPATPAAQGVWYDEDVMELARSVRRHGYYSMGAVAKVVQDMQAQHAGGEPGQVQYTQHRYLTRALTMYSLVKALLARGQFTVGGASAATPGIGECPCCWRECTGVCGDACLGLRRFRAAAREQDGLLPLNASSPFVPDAEVEAKLAQRPAAGRREGAPAAQHACSNFKAAQVLGKQAQHYDRTGVAALLCRHGFVLRACTMSTAENYTYYELLLSDVLKAYFSEPGKSIKFVFIDVACKMEATLKRAIRDAGLPPGSAASNVVLLVGPWHIAAHKAECQVLFNARLMKGTGLTFGDLPDHLWAALRRYAGSLAYMGDAGRQDILAILIVEREQRKLTELAAHLFTVFERSWLRACKILEDDLAGVQPDASAASPCETARSQEAHGVPPLGQRQAISNKKRQKFKLIQLLERQHLLESLQLAATPLNSPGTVRRSGPQHGPERVGLVAELQSLGQQIARAHTAAGLPHMEYGDEDYKALCTESKQHHITNLHYDIESTLVKYSTLAVTIRRRLHTLSRRETQRLSRQKARAAERLKSLVQQLQRWHSVYGDVTFNYDVAQLNSNLSSWLEDAAAGTGDGQEQGGMLMLPWSTRVAHFSKQQLAQQCYLRCVEECDILEREACDLVAYYTQQAAGVLSQLQAVAESLEVLRAGSTGFLELQQAALEATVVLGHLQGSCSGPHTQQVDTKARQRKALMLQQGCAALRNRRLEWIQQRRKEGEDTLAKMRLRRPVAAPVPDARAHAAPVTAPATGRIGPQQPAVEGGSSGEEESVSFGSTTLPGSLHCLPLAPWHLSAAGPEGNTQ